MAKRRNFTPEFKAEVVLEALSGQSSQAELCRTHNLSDVQLSKWKRQLLENEALSKLCELITLCDRFARHSVSIEAVSIINRKRILVKQCSNKRLKSYLLFIQDMVIDVSPSCYCVWDTLLDTDASHD